MKIAVLKLSEAYGKCVDVKILEVLESLGIRETALSAYDGYEFIHVVENPMAIKAMEFLMASNRKDGVVFNNYIPDVALPSLIGWWADRQEEVYKKLAPGEVYRTGFNKPAELAGSRLMSLAREFIERGYRAKVIRSKTVRSRPIGLEVWKEPLEKRESGNE